MSTTKNILVLGAAGLTGRQVVDAALRSGASVTAFVRNASTVPHFERGVALHIGNATSSADLTAALPGHDVVVSALGAGNSITAVRSHQLFSRASAALVQAAHDAEVRRIVWLSSFGVGDSYSSASAVQKAIYRTLLRDIYRDKAIADETIRASGSDWTIVLPTRLTDGPSTGAVDSADMLPMKGNPEVSRADVGAFLVETAHTTEWIGRSPVISARSGRRFAGITSDSANGARA
ncbi:NAD(P)-dependent oxidoreductase [Rhodococcus sp. 06-1460-1B]|uniref:NAD(P)-dependent oxidoreductase n=1 Tax=Rhodococcus sp. 06-1460-1B TaxID=2022501 RepID=UPI000B9A2638|nr:NAD(P)-binding oxidoreductase [Rhodococcus sp. 06-1460-1B]OZD61960.1 nucleoside-diphosphate sugar epimerase [Rhodococcus sp. 06-1460-1B]